MNFVIENSEYLAELISDLSFMFGHEYFILCSV